MRKPQGSNATMEVLFLVFWGIQECWKWIKRGGHQNNKCDEDEAEGENEIDGRITSLSMADIYALSTVQCPWWDQTKFTN